MYLSLHCDWLTLLNGRVRVFKNKRVATALKTGKRQLRIVRFQAWPYHRLVRLTLTSPECTSQSRPGARFSKVPRTFRARKAIRKTTTCLFCKAGLLICCKGNKNKNNCKVSCLETPSFRRYKENYVTRNTPEKFRDFRETGPWVQFSDWRFQHCTS